MRIGRKVARFHGDGAVAIAVFAFDGIQRASQVRARRDLQAAIFRAHFHQREPNVDARTVKARILIVLVKMEASTAAAALDRRKGQIERRRSAHQARGNGKQTLAMHQTRQARAVQVLAALTQLVFGCAGAAQILAADAQTRHHFKHFLREGFRVRAAYQARQRQIAATVVEG